MSLLATTSGTNPSSLAHQVKVFVTTPGKSSTTSGQTAASAQTAITTPAVFVFEKPGEYTIHYKPYQGFGERMSALFQAIFSTPMKGPYPH